MYLSETEEIIAIIICCCIVIGFVVKTIQDIKSTIAEEKEKAAQQKADEEKVKTLISYLDAKNELIQTYLKTKNKIDQNSKEWIKSYFCHKKAMDTTLKVHELLEHIEHRIAQGDYKDSVHKITLMTTRDVIQKILVEDFE